MKKHADAFRSIGEVAKLIGVAPHVLRYWETQFTLLKPMKRPDGRRYYRPEDVRLVAGLCEILREEGLTIRGARKMLARDRGEAVRARGAARLGDLLGAGLGEDEAAETRAPDAARAGLAEPPEAAAPAPLHAHPQGLPQESPLMAELGDLGPEALSEEDLSPMPDHSPRSRHRHRRRNGASDGSLPLFPDLDAPAEASDWLGRLAALAARLRDLPEGDRRAAAARPGLAALRDAITTLY